MFAAERRKKPYRNGPRVGERLIGVISEFLDRRGQVQGRVDVYFVVLGVILAGNLADVGGFVEAAAGEGNRERFHPGTAPLPRVMKDGRRIHAPAAPNSQRHIGTKATATALRHEAIEL